MQHFILHDKSKIVGCLHLVRCDVKFLVSQAQQLLMQMRSDPSSRLGIETVAVEYLPKVVALLDAQFMNLLVLWTKYLQALPPALIHKPSA